MTKAVVFAYHDVGVRCLLTLLAHGVDVRLVVTHTDDPGENHWFASVAETAALYGIPVIQPDSPVGREVIERVAAHAPDFLFSFYYRHLLPKELLELPRCGAYNMHGSLLPHYRGRAPVNWAVLHGESETGASLHCMVTQPDAGDLVGQLRTPILPNDTAVQVLHKVTCAAELLLDRCLPSLLDGRAEPVPLDLSSGSYYGRRTPADGCIDWCRAAWDIHNLIRAVAPPYPGAFFDFKGVRISVLGSHYCGQQARHSSKLPMIYWDSDICFVDCVDGIRLCLPDIRAAGKPLNEAVCRHRFGTSFLQLSQESSA